MAQNLNREDYGVDKYWALFCFFCRLSFGYVNHPGGNPPVFCIRYRSQKTVSKSPPLMFCKLQILRGILFPSMFLFSNCLEQ